MGCVHVRSLPLHLHHSQGAAEGQPHVPHGMPYVVGPPLYRGPKRSHLVSIRQSRTLRRRAGQLRQHNARVLPRHVQGL